MSIPHLVGFLCEEVDVPPVHGDRLGPGESALGPAHRPLHLQAGVEATQAPTLYSLIYLKPVWSLNRDHYPSFWLT